MNREEIEKSERRGRYRRDKLEELGFKNVSSVTNVELDEMINNPSGVETSLDEVVRVGRVPHYGVLRELLNAGVKLPDKYVEKAIETLEGKIKDRVERISKSINLAPIYIEQIQNESDIKEPSKIEVEAINLRRAAIQRIIETVEAHIDIEYTDEYGNIVKYTWGKKNSNNVVETMFKKLENLSLTQGVWLNNAIKNGSLLSDSQVYDSDGDGASTKFLASVHHMVDAAMEVGDDGIHPDYGDMTPNAMNKVFETIAGTISQDELNTMSSEERIKYESQMNKIRDKSLIKSFRKDVDDLKKLI